MQSGAHSLAVAGRPTTNASGWRTWNCGLLARLDSPVQRLRRTGSHLEDRWAIARRAAQRSQPAVVC